MALSPRFAGQKLAAQVSPYTLHTLEVYLDYGIDPNHSANLA